MEAADAVSTVEEYLAQLPADRRDVIARVREVVNANLPDGFEEGVQYGMISWYVPLSRYPDTHNGQPAAVASLGSQRTHMALYLMSVYGSEELDAWFRGAFAKAGKKLDMGKSCVRFKSLDALPLDVIGETIRRVSVDDFLARYEAARGGAKSAQGKAKPAAGKPAAAGKAAAGKPAAGKPAATGKPAAAAGKPAAAGKAKPRAKR